MDWIDPNNDVRSGGAEANYYHAFGRTCKNDFLDSVRELLLIKGFDAEVFWGTNDKKSTEGLYPYVTVYSNQRININTASEVVLMSLDDDLDSSLAKAIIDYRENKPFENTNDLREVGGDGCHYFFTCIRKNHRIQ